MANPLFPNKFQNVEISNMMNLMDRFNDFRSTFQGDPKQQVEDLLNSGRLSRDEFNQLSEMAKNFQKFLR